MKKNLNTFDKIIRFVIGIVLLYLAFLVFENTILKILAIAIGLLCIVESLASYCYLYQLLGINTHRGAKK